MKKSLIILLLLFVSQSFAQEKYEATLYLDKVENDQVPVELIVPSIDEDTIEYHMPKIVPGTYSISDFGRFVVDFQALDSLGNDLEVERISTNRWQIASASKLHRVKYLIEDSFDDFEGYGDNKLFEPGGTSIDAGSNTFVINTFGFVGYLEGHKFKPYYLTIKHPAEIKGAGALEVVSISDTSDTYKAANYNFFADAPFMYCEPDITSKEIAGANIIVSVYSPNKVLSSADVMSSIDELMEAQASYLGGALPVDKYAYLIYLFDGQTISGAYGALEHSYSSLYSLPEMEAERINQIVKDVAAHEFLHIVTPLNIHSEEIHNFNYIEPEMSQHLWLYEGVTEYSSQHVQVKYDLFEVTDFLEQMRDKMVQQEQYNVDIPYTEFSENILEPENEARYGDVYAGGALIAMCLDLTIIKSTQGDKNLQWLMRALSEIYGPLKAFKDAELFDVIEKMTTQEVGNFLRKHVGGTAPLPYEEILGWAGVSYQKERQEKVVSAGKFIPTVNEAQEIVIADIDNVNAFGKDLGFQKGDVLINWNGAEVTLQSFQQVISDFYENTEENDKVTVIVRREVKGKSKEKKLKAKAILVERSAQHDLQLIKDATAEQLRVRDVWLSAK
ncbi:MAG: peptidase M61 [Bacteroidota bacterium]